MKAGHASAVLDYVTSGSGSVPGVKRPIRIHDFFARDFFICSLCGIAGCQSLQQYGVASGRNSSTASSTAEFARVHADEVGVKTSSICLKHMYHRNRLHVR